MAIFRFTDAGPYSSLPRTRQRASFGLLGSLLVTGAVGFAGCGDDGNLLGSEGTAGMSNGGSSGSNATAGSAHAGAVTSAGTANGGATTGGGTTSTGGATCDIPECLRANVCLDKCGGKVVYSGCCACPASSVEELSCAGGGGQGSGGAGSADCVGATCTAQESCVAYRTVGGAVMPPDTAGHCMAGQHLEGNMCQSDFAYTCAALTGCSAPAATCRCAPNTKCANTTVCSLPPDSAWLDTDAQLVCQLLAP